MYVIIILVGLIIKWVYFIGIVDIYFGFRFNLLFYIEGFCGEYSFLNFDFF